MFTPEQKARIYRAAEDLRTMGRTLGPSYDCVDLATDTDNYWWLGLNDRKCRIGGRFLYMVTPKGRR